MAVILRSILLSQNFPEVPEVPEVLVLKLLDNVPSRTE
jgi:hypothetical protein